LGADGAGLHIPWCQVARATEFCTVLWVFSMYVTLKDRKRSLSGKKRPQRVVALEKQLQREIACCGCF